MKFYSQCVNLHTDRFTFFVARQPLLQIYALLSVKLSGLDKIQKGPFWVIGARKWPAEQPGVKWA